MTTALTLNSLLDRSPAGRAIAGVLSDPKRFWIIMLLIYLSLVPVVELFRGARSEPHGDVKLYQRTIENIWHGKMPYRDFEYEYPPYSIPFFVIPSLFKSPKGFQIAFGVQILLIDLLVKGILIWMAVGLSRESRAESRANSDNAAIQQFSNPLIQPCNSPSLQHSITPFLPVLLFSLATAANHYFYLQRYDLIPAALTLGVLAAWWKERYLLAGLLLMAAIGCKLYPILFVPPLWITAWRLKQARPFTFGIMLGVLPLLLLGLALPWWNFLAFHTGRGLQCESLYASIIWFIHHLGLCDASWTFTKAWVEVTGSAASSVIPYAKYLFLISTAISIAISGWRAFRSNKPGDVSALTQSLFVIILTFVALAPVLSPQYLIWLLAFSGSLLTRIINSAICTVCIAAMMIPVIYPGTDYSNGLNYIESMILLFRNILLSVALFLTMRPRSFTASQ